MMLALKSDIGAEPTDGPAAPAVSLSHADRKPDGRALAPPECRGERAGGPHAGGVATPCFNHLKG